MQGVICCQEDRVPGITSIDGVHSAQGSRADELICGFQVKLLWLSDLTLNAC